MQEDASTTGVNFLRLARKILRRDFAAAFADGEWGLAVRRAQESVEFAIKGALLVLGRVPPKTHAPGQLKGIFRSRFPIVAFELNNESRCFLFVEISAQVQAVIISPSSAGVRITIPVSRFPPDVMPLVLVESDGREVRVSAAESGTFLASCPTPGVPVGRCRKYPLRTKIDALSRTMSTS